MKILGNNKDKFGFYQVGAFETYSKVEAIELHKRTGIHPHWNFNEAFFSSYNWTTEPTETLEQLYKKRAEQIRNDYDYVVLFYSGGADSENILDTFVDNNIAIDEIATYNHNQVDSDPASMFNSEQLKISYPRITALQNQGIKFKHRSIDMSEITAKILTDSHYNTNRGYYSTSHFGVTHISKSYIRESIPEYQKLIEQGKKVVFVWGSEKPRLYQDDGRYCIKFLDLIDSGVSIRTQILKNEWEYDELFYWSPEGADIVCKQGHILKRFFEQHKIFKENDYHSDKLINLPNVEDIFANRYTEDGLSFRNIINLLIYPKFNSRIFSCGKPTSVVLSLRDQAFNNDAYYGQQVKKLKSHLSQLDAYWHNDVLDINKGLKLCISPSYFLH
jgi:hypothetical protein